MVLRCGVAVATGRRSGRLTVRHNDASAELFSSAERDFALFDFRLEGTRGLWCLGNRLLLSRPAWPDGTPGVCQVLPGALKPPLIRANEGPGHVIGATECWRRLITVLQRDWRAAAQHVRQRTFGSKQEVNQGVHVSSRFRRLFVCSVFRVVVCFAEFPASSNIIASQFHLVNKFRKLF